MTSFNFEDNPFRRIREEIDQLQCQYSKVEYITKGACNLLGNYKPIDLCKELEEVVQQKDTSTLEADNATLAAQVADFKVEITLKNEELRQLQAQSKEGLDWIRDFIGHLGDMVNKARLFDNDIKTEG